MQSFWSHSHAGEAAASLFSGSPAGISLYQCGISHTFCPQLWRRRRAYNIKFILDGVGKAFYFQHRSGRKEEEKITIALSDGVLSVRPARPPLYVMFMWDANNAIFTCRLLPPFYLETTHCVQRQRYRSFLFVIRTRIQKSLLPAVKKIPILRERAKICIVWVGSVITCQGNYKNKT